MIADQFREDVVAAGYAVGGSGFSVQIPKALLRNDPCTIEVIDCRQNRPLFGSPMVITAEAKSKSELKGYIESFDGRVISGWASDGTETPVTLRVIVNGETFREVVADAPRDDVVAAGAAVAGVGAGFSIKLPKMFSLAGDSCVVEIVERLSNTPIPGSPCYVESEAADSLGVRTLSDALRRLVSRGFIELSADFPSAAPQRDYVQKILDYFSSLQYKQQLEAFWFFDSKHYAEQSGIPCSAAVNLLAHFFVFGLGDNISPHPLIQPQEMLKARPDLFGKRMRLPYFVNALTMDWCDPSSFVWLTWYRAHSDVRPNENALLHYLKRGSKLNLRPNPYFEPDVYRQGAPDAPQNGIALVQHFLDVGDQARVSPSDRFDPSWYVSQYAAELAGAGPLGYYLSTGRHIGHKPRGDEASTPEATKPSEPTNDIIVAEKPSAILDRWTRLLQDVEQTRQSRLQAFKERAITSITIVDHVAALRELEFAQHDAPDVDILIPCYNEFEITVECLVALQRMRSEYKLRIIIADDASPDERLKLLENVPGLNYIRNPENLHFLRSCNRAFGQTFAPFLLLLNNDTQVFEDAIDVLMATMRADERIGAVAPMFLYPNGRLQEAGCTLRSDGDSTMIGVGEDPGQPCYNHRREIQYGSGAGLLLRRTALDGELFDERLAPAYCEDADLCIRLRHNGWRVVYEPAARIIHHLSVSTSRGSRRRRVQLSRRNQQKLMENWREQLRHDNKARVLAFYLPQFHPIDRNNIWWGRGFTEWTNVTRALPSFEGHYQPHLPADLGFYDLRRVEIMGEQQALARRYGVEGFVVYYYNFGADRVLEQPMETLLRRPEIDFQFALCWANENWTRHWDGGERSILLEQLYDDATLDSVATDMARFASDARAIRVNGKPLVMIYRPLLIPEIKAVTERMRARFADAGLPKIHLVYVESMEAIEKRVKPADIGFDACVEFPPQGIAEPYSRPVAVRKRDWNGHLYDYAGTVKNAILRPRGDYPRYPAVTPSWDNTARQPLKGTTLVGAEPELFQAYVECKLEEMLNFSVGDERLLFVNAWNEWAEGAHLEPDRAYGHRWLASLRTALTAKGVLP
jgi:GT2 family glycosyltransferase